MSFLQRLVRRNSVAAPKTTARVRRRGDEETNRAKVDAVLAPPGELPGSSMSYRGVFELAAAETLTAQQYRTGDVSVEVTRARTADDSPKYLIVIVAHRPEVIETQRMIEFGAEFTRRLQVLAPLAAAGLLGLSWSPSQRFAAAHAANLSSTAKTTPAALEADDESAFPETV